MKRWLRLILFLLLTITGISAFAQSVKNDNVLPKFLCLSSSDLLSKVCRIKDSTTIGGVTFLAVITCIIDSTSQPGFYMKNGDKWLWIPSRFREEGNYFPADIIGYSDLMAYRNIGRDYKGRYKYGKLIGLIYLNEDGHDFLEIFDLESKKVVAINP